MTALISFDVRLRRDLRGADIAQLNEIVVQVSSEMTLGLIDLLEAWWKHLSKFEADVHVPPDDHSVWGAHDYVAALIIRDLLAQALVQVPQNLRRPVESVVAEVDQRLLSFTEPDEDGCTEQVDGRVDASRGWWWKRVPQRGPIREELELHFDHRASNE